jgi:hypothetical protein
MQGVARSLACCRSDSLFDRRALLRPGLSRNYEAARSRRQGWPASGALLGLLGPHPPGSLDGGEHGVTLRRVGTAAPRSEDAPCFAGRELYSPPHNTHERLNQSTRDHRLRSIPFVNGRASIRSSVTRNVRSFANPLNFSRLLCG